MPAPRQFRKSLIAIQLLVGIGALYPGLSLVIDPSGAGIGLPPNLIAGTAFGDFFVPGLFLFVGNGLANVAGALSGLCGYRHHDRISLLLGIYLTSWIIVQIAVIGPVFWLQAVFLAIGLAEIALTWVGMQEDTGC